MAQPSNYTMGYSKYTTATHQSRTADSEAAFLVPHIKKTDHILDVGCGPGTITTNFAKYASEGSIIGVDISTEVLTKAKALAAEAHVSTQGPGSVVFEYANVLERLPYPDNTFDIVFCSQLLGHMPPPDLPRQALAEMHRVLKPDGILASRHQAFSRFYPQSLNLDRLWSDNLARVLHKGAPDEADSLGMKMPSLLRSVGFDADGGKVQVGAGTTVFSTPQTRQWLGWRAAGQLTPRDTFYQSWLDAGISEDEIQETLQAVKKWVETDDAWFASLQSEILAWK